MFWMIRVKQKERDGERMTGEGKERTAAVEVRDK